MWFSMCLTNMGSDEVFSLVFSTESSEAWVDLGGRRQWRWPRLTTSSWWGMWPGERALGWILARFHLFPESLGYPQSSIFVGFSIYMINHPFRGTPMTTEPSICVHQLYLCVMHHLRSQFCWQCWPRWRVHFVKLEFYTNIYIYIVIYFTVLYIYKYIYTNINIYG